MKRNYEKKCRENAWWEATYMAMCLKILFPEKVGELELNKKWKKMLQKYRFYDESNNNEWNLTYLGMRFKILFPEKVGELELDKKWEKMKKRYEDDCRRKSWWSALDLAASLKVLAAKQVKITDQGLELIMEDQEDFKDEVLERPERLKCE